MPVLAGLVISAMMPGTLAQKWSEGAAMPTERAEISATNIGDDIYVAGGLD